MGLRVYGPVDNLNFNTLLKYLEKHAPAACVKLF